MSKPIVICVDDEPTVLESLKIELKRTLGDDCLIETAEGGEEALELLAELQQQRAAIALVLADYIMPGLKGDELLRQIHDASPHTLNIMLSGQADLEAVGNAIRYARLYRFITKPWNPKDLSLTVSEAINSYLQARQLAAKTAELHQANQNLAQLSQQLQHINENLELQVQERTAQLQQQMQELKELSQLKDFFLNAVTHDLRTPIMGTLLVLKKLQNHPQDPVSLSRSTLDRMIQSSERQLQMLEWLLESHLTAAQGMPLQCQPTNFSALVQAIIHDLDPLLQNHQATVNQSISPHLPLINVDAAQLRRVFENLITNALKHNPPGVDLLIEAALVDSQDINATSCAPTAPPHFPEGPTIAPLWLRCHIQDNGIGMTAAESDALFDLYTQGSRLRPSLGIGLGLHLCRLIITAHGGQIGIISAPHQGATFWFTLPVTRI
jgi:two-component system, sensor histidine kinase and response regulator